MDNLVTLEPEPQKISVALCLCKRQDSVHKALYDSHIMALEDKKKTAIVDGIEAYEKLILEYEDDSRKREIKYSLDSMTEFLTELTNVEMAIQKECYVEDQRIASEAQM